MRNPPKEIADAIEIANFGIDKIPPSLEWLTVEEQKLAFPVLWEKLPTAFKESRNSALSKWFFEELVRFANGEPPLAVEPEEEDLGYWRVHLSVPGGTVCISPYAVLHSLLVDCVSAREGFLQLIKWNAEPTNQGRYYLHHGDLHIRPPIIQEGVMLWETSVKYPFNVILDTKVDTRRIRLCAHCSKFFWVTRTDAKEACPECSNKARQMRFRKGHQYGKQSSRKKDSGDDKRKKRQEYYEKKGIEFCSICIRPLSTHGYSQCVLNGG
jgi:hypothetical protein